MKKLLILLFTLTLVLGLCACNQQPEPTEPEVTQPVIYTFPAGTSLLGVDISGMERDAAWAALQESVGAYAMTLHVDGTEAAITAQDIDLACSKERFDAIADGMEWGVEIDYTGLISFNEGKLRALADKHFNQNPVEAAVVYDEATGQYTVTPHADGQKSNPNAIVAAVKDAICKLSVPEALTGASEILHPERTSDAQEVTEALDKANKMLSTRLTYTFTAGDETSTHEIPAETIRSFVTLGSDGISPKVDTEAVEAYVNDLSDKYSIAGTSKKFKTTGGDTVNLKVAYNGLYVDKDELVDDIKSCIKKGLTDTRTAPYQASGIRNMPYGGTYIEINLSAQKLWYYKNGKLIVSSNLVSGKVADNMCTPTGVYSIYNKKPDAYLTGEDYRTFVNYWMPFYGGYGLHDATWRGAFGGDIYLYGGSHGCVNLPLSTASKIFNNVTIGTKVILYGGERSVSPQKQKLTGTTSYKVADDKGTIKLKIKAKYGSPTLTYESSDTSVATVNSKGVVTIKGIGTAKITVTAAAYSYYTKATTTVTIKVHSACDDGRHDYGDWTVTKAETCGTKGSRERICATCGHKDTESIKATGNHSYGDWTVTKAETCGKDGKKVQVCSVCGDEKAETIKATGNHTFGNWSVSKEPTCGKAGTEKRACSGCDKTESREIAATGNHTYDKWETDKKPTCTEAGVEKEVCSVCGHASGNTRPVDAKGHDFDWKTTKKATCTEKGTEQQQCQRSGCKATGDSRDIDKKSHDYAWKTTQEPTCTDSGTKKQICKDCGAEGKTDSIPAKGHSYESGKCTGCGADQPAAAGE